tara:strand:- start:89 stop:1015 length:927 start_codon:yes stop_codon:yes gene_type:complete
LALEKPLSGFESFSLLLFGWLARPLTKDAIGIRNDLIKARISMLPMAYAATSIMIVFLTFIVCAALTLMMLLAAPNLTSPTGDQLLSIPIQIGLCFFLLVIIPSMIAAVQYYSPGMTSYQRGRDMDKNLPYAASYVAAMSAANATPDKIFKSLARNLDIYGELSNEAAWIYQNMTFVGQDLVSTLKAAVERSPSEKFGEFIQGMVGTITSGGNMKLYFLNRSEYYAQENRVAVKDLINQMALYAEVYVVVAVAFPIFAMIMALITFWVSGSGMTLEEEHLYAMVFGGLPLIQSVFSFIFWAISDEIGV